MLDLLLTSQQAPSCKTDLYRLQAFYFRFTEKYIDEKDITNPKASAILQKKFSGLPPALIILAELDQNRDQGYGETGLR